MTKQIEQNALYPIREVARLTGVKPITLRAWERRYNLLEPIRTESGHRLYSQEHIELLNQTLRLMEEGIPISRVKAVLSERAIIKPESQDSLEPIDYDHLLEKLTTTTEQFQVQALEKVLDRIFADYSSNALLNLLVNLDQMLNQKLSSVAYEFWQTGLLRRLDVRLHLLHTQPLLPSRRILVINGHNKQPWLTKLVALFCFEQGYQPIFFNQKIPLENLLEVNKNLAINGIIYLDSEDKSQLEWQVWFEHYPTLHSWVFGSENVEQYPPASINCELRAWPKWFTPLGLGN